MFKLKVAILLSLAGLCLGGTKMMALKSDMATMKQDLAKVMDDTNGSLEELEGSINDIITMVNDMKAAQAQKDMQGRREGY